MTDEKLRILLVEDSDDDAVLICNELGRGGLEFVSERVYTAEGLRAALDEHPWDIILSDYRMPQFDAPAALEIVRKSFPHIPFIMISGTVGEEAAVRCMRAGATDYLMKDRLARLVPAIKRELEEAALRREYEQTQLALSESNQKLAEVLAESPIGISLYESSGQCVMANEMAAEIVGAKREQVLAQNFHKIESWKRAGLYEAAVAVLRGPSRQRRDVQVVTTFGKDVWLDAFLAPVLLPSGMHLLLMITDITEHRKTEAKQHQANRFSRALISTMPFALDIVDEDGHILFMNAAMQAAAGKDTVLSHSICWETYRDDKTQCGECPLREGVAPGTTRKIVTRGVLGGKTMEVYHTGIMHDGKRAYLEIFIDITANEAADAEIRRVHEQFHLAQKFEAVGRLAGGISHDFNNVLTSIMMSAEFLGESLPPNDPQHDSVDQITEAVKRAAQLTRQLLAFSSKQVLEPQVLDVNAVVKDMQKLLNRTISEQVEIVTKLAPKLSKVKADEGQLGQVILNLALNANDAMPDGGKLQIKTADVEFSKPVQHPGFTIPAGHFVTLSLSDTGHGMTPEIKEHVFEPFFTTKERGKGTGLGMSSTYGIVKQSDGCILVESEVGHGSTITVFLPATQELPVGLRKAPTAPISLHGSETILIAEDDPAVRAIGRRTLENRGYKLLEASSGEEALEILDDYKEPVRLLFTDIVMGGMGGVELARRALASRPEIKVIFTSGYSGEAVSESRDLISGQHFITKPFTTQALGELVRKVLDSPEDG